MSDPLTPVLSSFQLFVIFVLRKGRGERGLDFFVNKEPWSLSTNGTLQKHKLIFGRVCTRPKVIIYDNIIKDFQYLPFW